MLNLWLVSKKIKLFLVFMESILNSEWWRWMLCRTSITQNKMAVITWLANFYWANLFFMPTELLLGKNLGNYFHIVDRWRRHILGKHVRATVEDSCRVFFPRCQLPCCTAHWVSEARSRHSQMIAPTWKKQKKVQNKYRGRGFCI